MDKQGLSTSYESKLSSALAKITKTPALTAGNLNDAVAIICEEGCIALGATRVGIWQVDFEHQCLVSLASYDLEERAHVIQDNFSFANKSEYIGLLSTERLIVINDAATDTILPNLQETYGPELFSLLDAPVRIGGELVGVVCIEQCHCSRHWSTDEQNFASSLADFTALAIESAQRFQALQELELSKRRSETLMSNLPGMVYQCLNDPPDFTFAFVSEGAFALTGYTSQELMGNNALKFFDMIHPEDVPQLEELNKQTLSAGLPLETTFRMIMKDGTIKWIWERSRVVEFNTDGTPRLLEGFYTDITEQRRLEAAELANKAKDEFLANMSHEIRTPMNAIMGMTEMTLRQNPPQPILENLLNIKSAAKSLLGIINDILDFSKIEARAVEITPEPYDVAAFLNDIVAIIRIRLEQKPIEFIVETCPNLPRALIGDQTRLKQIMINLLGNAVKFTSSGSIRFRLEALPIPQPEDKQEGTPENTPEDTYGTVLLQGSIEDTGRGIKQEDLPRLFGIFSQVDTKKNRNIEGTGLGLAITKNLLEIMGGTIDVTSEYGKGTCFTFTVPQQLADASPLDHPAETCDLQLALHNVRCLVVDDNEINLLIAASLLEGYNAHVDTADTGQLALEMVAAHPYDIIFMDHMMPEMDGIEATEHIRKLPIAACQTLPIIALTANAIKEARAAFLGCGMNDFLAKPIELHEVERVLKAWLPPEKWSLVSF